jgi:hypothetical protein
MKNIFTNNPNAVWLAVFAPIFFCALAVIASASIGATYLYVENNKFEATASAVYVLNAQRRITQTAAQVQGEQDRLTQTASAVLQRTQTLEATQQVLPSETPRPTATLAATFAGNFGVGTIIFKECRGKEGAVFFADKPPEKLHAYQDVIFKDIPAGTYKVKVDFPSEPDYNFNGEIQVRAGTQTIPLGDQCK